MKLNEYAKQCGVSYRTAWRWWKQGTLDGFQRPSGTIIITENLEFKDRNITKDKIDKDE
jgi:predicted site-specific integrase-resolvase